jgi:hypothetical protein
MKVSFGKWATEYWPGVQIDLTGNEVAIAISAYLVAMGIHVDGPRTITVNGELCEFGGVYIDPSGFIIKNGKKISGRCAEANQESQATDRQQLKADITKVVNEYKDMSSYCKSVTSDYLVSKISELIAQPLPPITKRSP